MVFDNAGLMRYSENTECLSDRVLNKPAASTGVVMEKYGKLEQFYGIWEHNYYPALDYRTQMIININKGIQRDKLQKTASYKKR